MPFPLISNRLYCQDPGRFDSSDTSLNSGLIPCVSLFSQLTEGLFLSGEPVHYIASTNRDFSYPILAKFFNSDDDLARKDMAFHPRFQIYVEE